MAFSNTDGDVLLITNVRIFHLDKPHKVMKSIKGNTNKITMIPYKSIVSYGIETEGYVDWSCELHLWTDAGWWLSHIRDKDG